MAEGRFALFDEGSALAAHLFLGTIQNPGYYI